MRCFTLYRRAAPEGHYKDGAANPADDPQLQGVVFEDGTVAVRWLTPMRSTSVWADFATFDAIHGHPEYDSVVVWSDPVPEEEAAHVCKPIGEWAGSVGGENRG